MEKLIYAGGWLVPPAEICGDGEIRGIPLRAVCDLRSLQIGGSEETDETRSVHIEIPLRTLSPFVVGTVNETKVRGLM